MSTCSKINRFIYEYQDKLPENKKKPTEQQHQRCNSLPGSLHACVGSFLNLKHKSSHTNISTDRNPAKDAAIKPLNTNTVPINPISSNINAAAAAAHNSNSKLLVNNVSNSMHSAGNVTSIPFTFEINKPKIVPSMPFQPSFFPHPQSSTSKFFIKQHQQQQQQPISSSIISSINQSLASSMPNSPASTFIIQKPIYLPTNFRTQQQPPPQCFYFQHQASGFPSPMSPAMAAQLNAGKTTKISVQLGPKGITKINTLNYMTPPESQNKYELGTSTVYSNHLRKTNIPIQTPNSQPVVYRTELTILPSSFNKHNNAAKNS